jgi:cytochrome c553
MGIESRGPLHSTGKYQALSGAFEDAEGGDGTSANPEAPSRGATKAKRCGRQNGGIIGDLPRLSRCHHAKFAMKKAAAKWLLVAIAMIGFHASGWSENVDAGKKEYLSNCADCHGPDGKGTGPHASKLKTKLPT